MIDGFSISKENGAVVLKFYEPAVQIVLAPQMARDIGGLMVAYSLQLGAKEPESQEERESRPPSSPSW
jgi:hypothetical protein